MILSTYQLFRSSVSSAWDFALTLLGFFRKFVETVSNGVVDTFDTIVYYAMNSVMIILSFFELIFEVYEAVDTNVNLILSGYRNGFFKNI
ncbi:hypothetical protein CANTEDRAFT_116899, partial [Yamadazyma tenuis ATCC 10573]